MSSGRKRYIGPSASIAHELARAVPSSVSDSAIIGMQTMPR